MFTTMIDQINCSRMKISGDRPFEVLKARGKSCHAICALIFCPTYMNRENIIDEETGRIRRPQRGCPFPNYLQQAIGRCFVEWIVPFAIIVNSIVALWLLLDPFPNYSDALQKKATAEPNSTLASSLHLSLAHYDSEKRQIRPFVIPSNTQG